MRNILYIDDESHSERFQSKAELLEERGYRVIPIASVAEVESALRDQLAGVAAIVLDIMMPPLHVYDLKETNGGTNTGFAVLRDIRKVNRDIPIVIVSVKPKAEALAEIGTARVDAYLERPVLPSAIADVLDRVLMDRGGAQ